jgi:hypothetical protein
MCDTFEGLADAFSARVARLSDAALGADEAAALIASLSKIQRLVDGAQTLAMARVQATGAWKSSAHRSSALWLAAQTKTSLSEAITTVKTASLLDAAPATRSALIAGELSAAQASPIVEAAAVDPACEERLLAMARAGESVATLRDRAGAAKAAAMGDELASERARRARFLRCWPDAGGVRIDGLLPADSGARVMSALSARAQKMYKAARASKTAERKSAYWADALVSIVDGDAGPKGVVNVVVSATALERGHTIAGEQCEIVGGGPISVAVAKQIAGDGVVRIVEQEGVDVRRIVTKTRTIREPVRAALMMRSGGKCEIVGCDARDMLEIDHLLGYELTRRTKLGELIVICAPHHAKKTYFGWRVVKGEGGLHLMPPPEAPP